MKDVPCVDCGAVVTTTDDDDWPRCELHAQIRATLELMLDIAHGRITIPDDFLEEEEPVG